MHDYINVNSLTYLDIGYWILARYYVGSGCEILGHVLDVYYCCILVNESMPSKYVLDCARI